MLYQAYRMETIDIKFKQFTLFKRFVGCRMTGGEQNGHLQKKYVKYVRKLKFLQFIIIV